MLCLSLFCSFPCLCLYFPPFINMSFLGTFFIFILFIHSFFLLVSVLTVTFMLFLPLFTLYVSVFVFVLLKARKTPSCSTRYNMTSAPVYSTTRRMRSSSRLCSMTETWPTAPNSCRTPHPKRLLHPPLSSGPPSSRPLFRQRPPQPL